MLVMKCVCARDMWELAYMIEWHSVLSNMSKVRYSENLLAEICSIGYSGHFTVYSVLKENEISNDGGFLMGFYITRC